MSEIISVVNVDQGLTTSVPQDVADAMMKAGDYLGYMLITDFNSKLVKDDKIKPGFIAIVNNQIPINLGKEVIMVILAERAKAMVFADQPLAYYDHQSKEFQETFEKAKGGYNSKCAAGLEFLVWVPPCAGVDGPFPGGFAALFCSNKGLKGESPNIRKMLKPPGQAIKMVAHKKQAGTNTWFTPITSPYTAPLSGIPDPQELLEELEKFRNPVSSTAEVATPGSQRAR